MFGSAKIFDKFKNISEDDDKPFKRQILSKELLGLRAKDLANQNPNKSLSIKGKKLKGRFKENYNVLSIVYFSLSDIAQHNGFLGAGADWLLDNYHVIDEQVREIRRDLPSGYYKALPKISYGDWKGYPRVYQIACDYLEHTDSLVELDTLTDYINSYQEVSALKLSELWAIPIMLRLALVENLRRLSESVLEISLQRQESEELFSKIANADALTPIQILNNLLEQLSRNPKLLKRSAPFLARRLRSLGSKSSLGIQWLEEQLKHLKIDLSEIGREQQQTQAADQISVGNSITSLKRMGRLNWRDWVESTSLINRILSQDPSGVFPLSDFYTRDHIRHRLEVLAQRIKVSEEEIAKAALDFSKANAAGGSPDSYLKSQVGYYLIDDGLPILEDSFAVTPPGNIKLQRFIKKRITRFYIAAFCLFSVAFTFLSLLIFNSGGEFSFIQHLLLGVFCLFPASQLSSELIQWLSGQFVRPKPLPKLEIETKVPDEYKTAVVIQSIIMSRDHLKKTVEDLEIRAIGNLDANIHYGILADLPDSSLEHQSGDRGLITLGSDLIKQLNEAYKNEGSKFFILFRKRQYNSAQGCFMGWERKRGKISEFNRLVRGAQNTSFNCIEADLEWLQGIQLVITLDNDTHLPPGTAKKLIGCAAHPLNKPVLDENSGLIVRGYGIIQPRVGITLESASASVFAQTFSGQSGLDPYTMAVSDVYQDLFKSASYVGKGIYHVDMFEQALDHQIPENTVLSHDLLESGFTRCGLASDIEVFDDFPQRYHSYAKRLHRWIRGDWQLLPWIFPISSNVKVNGKTRNLTSLVKWKMIDNLRRSLVPVGTLGLLSSLIILNVNALAWLPVIIFLLGFRAYSVLYPSLFSIPFGYSLSSYYNHQFNEASRGLRSILIEFITLPHQAYLSLDAIFRTLYRMFISKRNLLEWQSALSTEQRLTNSLSSFYSMMGPSTLIIVVALFVSALIGQGGLPISFGIVALSWLTSPFVAWKISNSRPTEKYLITQEEGVYLEDIAYDTWRYFRTHLREEHHYLIPDNLQQIPEAVVAMRTSPTNISLSLLATLSAYDLGFIPSTLALKRCSQVINSINKLEKHNGHLLNWYAIDDLRPLYPRYVSSVDSGNFIGHLMALREGLKSFPHSSFISKRALSFFTRRGLLGEISLSNQWKFYTELLPNIINSKVGNSIQHELVSDLADLSPFIEWLRHAEVLEVLGAKGLLPKKLERFSSIISDRPLTPSLAAKMVNRLLKSKIKINLEALSGEERDKIEKLFDSLEKAQSKLASFSRDVRFAISEIDKIVDDTQFEFLFDESKKLLAIGYNVDNATLDTASYDLLASEARLASFVAVATGDLPQTHWFVLGRALTDTPGGKCLISWSGTMFEYLMPTIVMKDYESTLLSQTYRSVIKAQRDYAARRNVPWGISESAYGTVDFENTYQYRAFGVPGLGLKRGLVEDLVISPYSTVLALSIETKASIANLRVLEESGARGEFGFYEAIDYTEDRLVGNESCHTIKSFFAHHQGMSLVAINNAINNSSIIERFHNDYRVKSCELLLQERFPSRIPLLQPHQAEQLVIDTSAEQSKDDSIEQFLSHDLDFPRTHLLSNGDYSVLIDHCGSGFSAYQSNLHINRFRNDSLNNSYGQFIYLRDEESGEFWSASYQPTRIEPDFYEVVFSPHKSEHHIKTSGVFSVLETIVSPEDSLEVRKLTITNHSDTTRKLSATSFFEVCLADYRADLAHPAFSKLFVSSNWDNELGYLLFNRKPRTKGDITPNLFHMVTSEIVWQRPQFCTDRATFIGRGRTLRNPESLAITKNLDLSQGFVLDPCASIRHLVELEPLESTIVYFITGIAPNKEDADVLVRKYREISNVRRCIELAWSYASVELKNQHFSKGSSKDFQRLANAIVYNLPFLRKTTNSEITLPPQNALWRLGISGDEPIVLLNLSENEQAGIFSELVLAHEYLRYRGITFDLVVLNERTGGYLQELQDELEGFISASLSAHLLNQRGGIFVKNALHISVEERELLEHVACVVINGGAGSFSSQLRFNSNKAPLKPATEKVMAEVKLSGSLSDKPQAGAPVGKFNASTNEFELEIKHGSLPPLPWSNVVANKKCGFLVTDTGTGYTWFGNSRENRLSPWSNDPILDPISEALYLRDCQTSAYWSPTLKPVQSSSNVMVTHGFGYSNFTRTVDSVTSDLTMFVSPDEPVKYWLLKLKNNSKEVKTLEAIFYLEWILGVNKADAFRSLATGLDQDSGFIYATNTWSQEFGRQVAVVGSNLPLQDFTTERATFIGQSGSTSRPAFLENIIPEHSLKRPSRVSGSTLSRKIGMGFDSAAILKYEIVLQAGEEKEISFYAHQAEDLWQAKKNIQAYSLLAHVKSELMQIKKNWSALVKPIQVNTPSKEFDNLVNGWLLYQTLSCRIYARTGFFQSSGALGFRDQLQDSLAFLMSSPELTRNQILLHASRQFEEGDVQHWWHPPSGRGIRSRITDNLLWLPFAILEYLEVTGKTDILEEQVGFLKGPEVPADKHDLYFTPEQSQQVSSLYDHCCRAIDRSLEVGSHGLPLMGTGDWNDGMNEVGEGGRGESVWLGWFLGGILNRFIRICEERGDSERRELYKSKLTSLVQSIEQNAWDGEWYRRAYFDDGTPLGSKQRVECRIDSLAQSWASLTNLGQKDKRAIALKEAYSQLFDKDNQLVRLLWPPLQNSQPSAGYIQSYPPGIRENGGQYTHGSTWLIAALAIDGFKDEAFELFNAMNPITHCLTPEMIDVYKTEPYVTCGDVYSHEQHAGRGGWSWYTGSSGWMYQVAIRYILGIRVLAQGLEIMPNVPSHWDSFGVEGVLGGKNFIIKALRSPETRMKIKDQEFSDVIPWINFQDEQTIIQVYFK